MSQLPPPIVLSFLVCDEIIVDSRSGKPSLIGVFNNIAAPTFPCTHPKMWLYMALTEGYGTADLRIRFARADSPDQPLAELLMPVQFASPRQIAEVHGQVLNLAIPEPGEYRFSIFRQDDLLTERRFLAVQPQQQPPAPPHQ